MKLKLLLIPLLLIPLVSKAIINNDSVVYSREGKFDYALIKDGELYTSIRPNDPMRTQVVRKSSVQHDAIPIRHSASCIGDPEIAFNWHLSNKTLFCCDMFVRNNSNARIGLDMNIVYRNFETRDSIVVSKAPPQVIKESWFICDPIAAYFSAYQYSGMGTGLTVRRIDKFYSYLNFDISFDTGDSLLSVYMRDKDMFYIWQAPIPNSNKVRTNWSLKKAYASPNFNLEFIPRIHNKLYDSTKTIHNAIIDTLFFEGYLKVVKQNDQKYIINREYGQIYHLGKNQITRIGTAKRLDKYPAIMGKYLFVEDLDKNRLIFFTPIEWEDTNLPKPNVYYMKEKEMQEYFKYVME